jgi:purine-binding chemotaxis protein CheW
MRPLGIEPIAGMPSFVAGVSIIRGAPTVVVTLSALVGAPACDVSRFVTIRAGERTVALAVEAVVGVRDIDDDRLAEAPPLLRGALPGIVDALGALDAELLLVLRTAKLVPDAVWAALRT